MNIERVNLRNIGLRKTNLNLAKNNLEQVNLQKNNNDFFERKNIAFKGDCKDNCTSLIIGGGIGGVAGVLLFSALCPVGGILAGLGLGASAITGEAVGLVSGHVVGNAIKKLLKKI